MQELENIVNRLKRPIYRILRKSQTGITEYELLKQLEDAGYLKKASWNDELELFQRHFLIFHTLYQLKFHLQEKRRKSIRISCMNLQIISFSEAKSNNLLADYDKLQEYYLDTNNLFNTSKEDVRGMLSDFWEKFFTYDKKGDAFAALGLDEDASLAEVKTRYRDLVKENHPDKGGNGKKIGVYTEAMKILEKNAN